MGVEFAKYHGLGNDYLVMDARQVEIDLTPETVRLICDRHYGVGADGILYGPIGEGKGLKVRIFNPDGSEAEKSGNGLRIFAKYLYEKGYVEGREFAIETLGGTVDIEVKDEMANLIRVGMGKVTFASENIPMSGYGRDVIDEDMDFGGQTYRVTCVSIGNPHCVIPVDEISEEEARRLGPLVENDKRFPNRINMQLLKVLDRGTIEIRIWERGAGYTLASGSSSCAAAAAARRLGLVGDEVCVRMPGGELSVEIMEDWSVFLVGPVEGVFEGVFHQDLKRSL